MSEATRTLLMPHHTFEDRGGIEVKGKVRVLPVLCHGSVKGVCN